MGKTYKDNKTHKKGFGKYGQKKPKRKMKPLSLDADMITGEKKDLIFIDNDISQENVDQFGIKYGKRAKKIREELRIERQQEKSSARSRMKKQLRDELNEMNLKKENND